MSSSSAPSSSNPLVRVALPDGQPGVVLSSGHSIPLLGFGTWGQADSPARIGEAVYAALKTGYRHLDCAEYYKNQAEIGDAIKKFLSENKDVKREDIFITTKVWNTNHAPENVKGSVLKSLKDLGVEYLDLVLIHWPLAWKHTGYAFENGGGFPKQANGELEWDRSTSLQQTYQALEKLVDEKLIRSIGVSNYPLISIIDLLTYARIKPSVHQVELHPYLSQQELVQTCEKNGILVEAYSPLGRPGTFTKPVIEDPTVIEIARELTKSEGHEVTPAHVLIAWHINSNRSPLPKSSTLERIASNLNAWKLKLNDSVLSRLNSLERGHRYVNIVLTGPNAGTFGARGTVLYE